MTTLEKDIFSRQEEEQLRELHLVWATLMTPIPFADFVLSPKLYKVLERLAKLRKEQHGISK